MQKKKILMLADSPEHTSGVGCQARHLIDGLLKTGRWSFYVFGGALRHKSYDIRPVDGNPDFIIHPVDNFGTPAHLRRALLQYKPDAVFIFNDPRFFIWLYEMEEEIHQMCPLVYWHVWDNDPYPRFNSVLYESTDLINCHSHLTYSLVSEHFPEKTNFIPHALPRDKFFPKDDETKMKNRIKFLGEERKDHFIMTWVNRNARRKCPGNVLNAWKLFLDKLDEKHGHRNATLLMHTAPHDPEGQNLPVIAEDLGIHEHVVYSVKHLSFEEMANIYNAGDCTINIAYHEGFGLGTLEAMQCARPIIALKTGGLTRQVVDHRDGTQNGIALEPDVRDLVGGQTVPYIYEDHVSVNKVVDAIFEMYEMGPERRRQLGQKAYEYVKSEFRIEKTIEDWDKTMYDVIERWKKDTASVYQPWEMKTL